MPPSMFVACFHAILDPKSATLSYANGVSPITAHLVPARPAVQAVVAAQAAHQAPAS